MCIRNGENIKTALKNVYWYYTTTKVCKVLHSQAKGRLVRHFKVK